MWRSIQSFVRRLKPSLPPKAPTFSEELLGKALGEIQKGDLEKARSILDELLQKEPEHLQALVYYGMAAMPRDFEQAGRALERALYLNPEESGALYWAGELKWMLKDWDSAILYLRKLAQLHPSAINWRRLGLVCKEAGRKKDALRAFSQAAEHQPSKTSKDQSIKDQASRIFDLYQLRNPENFCQAIEKISKSQDAQILPDALESLRKKFQNKNLLILASGPSLAKLRDFTSKIKEDQIQQLRFFGFNNVPVTEEFLIELKLPKLEIVCMSHPQVVKRHQKWLSTFLEQPKNVLCLPKTALCESPALLNNSSSIKSQLLFYKSESNHAPCSVDLLHFPPINTLMHVLPLSILGLPKKIFLFGCDGKITNESHFRVEDKRYAYDGYNVNEMAQWLRKDTFVFDEMIHPLLKACSSVWKVPIPKIFNCFEQSGHHSFEKIGPERFSQEISIE